MFEELRFKHAEFIPGENTTIRRGVKWALRDGNTVRIVLPSGDEVCSAIRTEVMRYCDLTDYDIALQHDEETRTLPGLFEAMRRAYPDFDKREIVTVVHFEIPKEVE